MSNPYENLPSEAFWRSAVAQLDPLDIANLWQPKHRLNPQHRVATAGSCFAQHIGRALVARGFNWFDAEPAPGLFNEETKKTFGYGLFSFRTGNIYTVAALKQWVLWSLGKDAPPEEFWVKDGRFYDPFRPNIEPNGFRSVEELKSSRESTFRAISKVIREADRFVFTLGLTEGWVHKELGHVYPMCPGTVAGEFDSNLYEFRNFLFKDVFGDLRSTLNIIKSENKNIRFLLTVSPVPLTATASGKHVLSATTYSKSILRAVAGQLADNRRDTDYFPSYEIITSTPFRGMFYEQNMRSVAPQGVDFVMASFFDCLKSAFGEAKVRSSKKKVGVKKKVGRKRERYKQEQEDDAVCEEAMLDAFGNNEK